MLTQTSFLLIAVCAGFYRKMVAHACRVIMRYESRHNMLLRLHPRRPQRPRWEIARLRLQEVKPLYKSIAAAKRDLLGHGVD